jgi:hypothetical protein
MFDIDHFLVAMSVREQVSQHRQRKYIKAILDESLDRCGFHLEHREAFPRELGKMHTEIINASGDPLTMPQQNELVAMMEVVRKEHDERRAAAEKREKEAFAAEYAKRVAEEKAKDDAIAAPYREARRLRNLRKIQKP